MSRIHLTFLIRSSAANYFYICLNSPPLVLLPPPSTAQKWALFSSFSSHKSTNAARQPMPPAPTSQSRPASRPAASVISACPPCLRRLFTYQKKVSAVFTLESRWSPNNSDLELTAPPALSILYDLRQGGNRNSTRLRVRVEQGGVAGDL